MTSKHQQSLVNKILVQFRFAWGKAARLSGQSGGFECRRSRFTTHYSSFHANTWVRRKVYNVLKSLLNLPFKSESFLWLSKSSFLVSLSLPVKQLLRVKVLMKRNFLLACSKKLSKWWRTTFILLWWHSWLPSYSRFWFMQIRGLVTSQNGHKIM